MSGLEIVEGDIERASNSIGDVAAATGVDPPADRPSAGRRGRMHARMEWAAPAWSDILQWDHRRSHGDRGLVAQMGTADAADGARGVDTAEHVSTRAPGIGDESGRRPGEPRRPGGTLPKTLRGGRRNTIMLSIKAPMGGIALGAVPDRRRGGD